MISLKLPEGLSSITIRIALALSLVFTLGKRRDELLRMHYFLALKYGNSDEVFLLPCRSIQIRIALTLR